MSQATKNKNQVKKRIIAFGFRSRVMVGVIKNLKNDCSVEILYWTAGKAYFMDNIFENKELFPNTIFHLGTDLVKGVPATGIDSSKFEPLGRDFIKNFLECQWQSLVMMDGINWSDVSLMKKVHIYHVYLKYWYGVLKMLKPDAIVHNGIPHVSVEYIVYHIAKYLGIKTIMLRNTQVGGRMLLVDDILDYKKLRERIDKNKNKNFTLNDLSLDVRDYFEKQQTIDKIPFYAREYFINKRVDGLFQFLPSMRAIKKNLRNLTFLKTTHSHLVMLFKKKTMLNLEKLEMSGWQVRWQERKWYKVKQGFKEEYMKYQIEPDYSKKYIYVPLQRQLERSTLSDGDVFADQILMIDILSFVIPKDWVIYVKESPLQWTLPRSHAGRFTGYTKDIVQRNNVCVVPQKTWTFDLIKNSQAVASVSGTAALEAIFRGKIGLIFGYTWFMYCDGIFRVHDVRSAKSAIQKIINGATPDKQKILNFFKSFDEATFRGYQDHRFRDGDDLNITFIKNDKENEKSITEAIYKELMSEA